MHLLARLRSRVAAVALLATTTAVAQPADPGTKIDDYVRAEMASRQIPGLALLVLKDHRVIFSGNYGLASLSTKTPVTGRTSFEIASMTKQFTDAAILLLAEQGKLALTDPISKYFVDLPSAWRAITIQQLMNHTAGLRDDWDEDDAFFTSKTEAAEFFEALKASPLKFSPGTSWSYSCGPFVLGLVIERVTGKPYAQFMRESIFDPLGMAATAVNDGAVNAPDRAAGYVLRDRTVQPGVHLPLAAHARGDVGIRTTTLDLAKWDAALDDPSFLPAARRAQMFSPGRLDNGEVIAYGFGWFVTPFRGRTEIAHGGSFRTGFDSAIARYPDDRLTIVIVTNRFHAGAPAMARVIASFYNDEYRPIGRMQPRPDRASSRTNVVMRVMSSLKRGDRPSELLPDLGRLAGWSREELGSELATASPPAFIDCQNLAGKSVTAFDTPIVANCFYRTGGNKPRYWTASFTADDRIAYLELEQ